MFIARKLGTAASGIALSVAVSLTASPALAEFLVSAQTQAALAAVNPSLTGDARTAAVDTVLESVLLAAIASGTSPKEAIVQLAQDAVADGIDGTTVATAITLAATAQGSSISARDLGAGLGQAAATLEKNGDKKDAAEFASVIANDGPDGSQAAWASSARQSGGSAELADTANSAPQVTGGSPLNDTFREQNFLQNNAAGIGVDSSCPTNNPSCNN